MRIGKKGTGQEPITKMCVNRHSGGSKAAASAAEKAIETKVRHQGRDEIREAISDREKSEIMRQIGYGP